MAAMAAALVVGGSVATVFACVQTPSASRGFLGSHGWATTAAPEEVPRNVAVVDAELTYDGSTRIPMDSTDHEGISRPAELLEPGIEVEAGGARATVVDVVDESPPEVPRILDARFEDFGREDGCRQTSCFGWNAFIEVEPPADDHALPADLGYAIYVAETGEELRERNEPRLYLSPHDDALAEELMAGLGELAPLNEPRELWIAVEALDLAANRSARSEPLRIRRGADGCSVASGAGPLGWVVLALALVRLRGRSPRQ